MAEGGVWADPEKARVVVQEVKELKRWVEPYHALRKRLGDARALHELTEAESDEDRARLVAEVLKGRSLEDEADAIAAQLEALELQNMLQGPDDARDALLTIHPGAGGTESQDWAEMLMRMYVRWAERHGFRVEVLDLLQGEEAGVKSAEIQISGRYAYGLLKAEKGVHRLVRISPFDAQSRRHTSFASVFVYPDVDEDIEIEIRDDDLRVDTFRASGRLTLLRPHGKATFGHLEDASGRIQLYFKMDQLGADAYEVVKLLDLGDFVGVEGPLFKTKTGEITVRVDRLTLLSKSLRPLPLGKEDAGGVRHGELQDAELRARQRYADLAVHPEVREIFRLRARVVTYLRKFLDT